MNSRGDPPNPGEKRGPTLSGEGPEIKSTGAGDGRFRFENTGSVRLSQSLQETDPYGRLIDTLEILRLHPCNPDEFRARWKRRPVSDRQRAALLKFGIDLPATDLNLPQGLAAQILDALIQRIQTPGLAWFPDVLWLYQHGVKDAGERLRSKPASSSGSSTMLFWKSTPKDFRCSTKGVQND